MRYDLKKVVNKLKINDFLKNSILFVIASFITKAISFLSMPIFTRMMSAFEYGEVSNFFLWGQLLSTFLCLQLSSGLVSAKMNRGENRFDSYMAGMIRAGSFFAGVFFAICFIFRFPICKIAEIKPDYFILLYIYAFSLCLVNMYSGYCIAVGKAKERALFSVIYSAFTVVFGLYFTWQCDLKSMGRIMGNTIVCTAVSVYILVYFYRRPLDNRKEFIRDIRFGLKFGLPLIPHLIANYINGNIDRIFIIKELGSGQQGVYSVAYSLGIVVLAFADACADAWNPWYYKKTRERSGEEIKRYFLFYTVTVSIIFNSLMLLSPELMRLMSSKEYWSGTACVNYIAFGIFFLFLYRFPLSYEQLCGNTNYVAPATIATALLNILLNRIWIPEFGIEGAAFATAVSYMVLWLLHEIAARKIMKGYNIRIAEYRASVFIVFSGFISAELLRDMAVIRYLVILCYCIGYLFYIKFALGFKRGIRNDWF